MKPILALLIALCLSPLAQAKDVPTPDSAVSFNLKDDPRNWTMVFMNGDRTRILAEFTLDREDINAWSEMVAQQIDFGALPLEKHFANWRAMLVGADPKIGLTEEHLPDGSILATYDSQSFDEVSVRRFIKGSDGVYMLAYHVRHRLKQAEIWARWTQIVKAASLIPNPEKRKSRAPARTVGAPE